MLIIFLTIGAGFVTQLVDLQSGQSDRSEDLRSQGQAQRTMYRELAGYRGSVIDRNGFVLAATTPSHGVVADPTMILDPTATAELIAPLVERDVLSLAEELRGESETDRWALLARTVSPEAADQIKTLLDDEAYTDEMLGIFLETEESRVYPAERLATPVVGRVDIDEVGIYGVEGQYNDVMAGTPGQMEFEASRFGSISVADWKVDPATQGLDVVLALDYRIQFMAEEALIAQCEKTGSSGATAVVSDPRTGEILAMAGVHRNDDGQCAVPIYNAALVQAFEPGSVIKTITMAAALEELGWTKNTEIEVPPHIVVGDKSFVDHPAHPTAPYSLTRILADSMNVGTIEAAQAVGPAQVHTYLERFGLGSTTGIGFKGETAGSVRPLDAWWGSDAGSIPIGQGLTVNATQLVAAYNVVASGGQYRSPILVRALQAPDGTQHAVDTPPSRSVISERTAQDLTDMLVEVVETGTGRPAAIDGFAVAGKTGTAWKAFEDADGKYSYGSDGNRRYVSTFAGFAPADDPRISIVVVVDEPTIGGTTASVVAAPVFAEIGAYSLQALGVAPEGIVGNGTDGGLVRALPAAPAEIAVPRQGEPDLSEVAMVPEAQTPNPDEDQASDVVATSLASETAQ